MPSQLPIAHSSIEAARLREYRTDCGPTATVVERQVPLQTSVSSLKSFGDTCLGDEDRPRGAVAMFNGANGPHWTPRQQAPVEQAQDLLDKSGAVPVQRQRLDP